MALIRLLQTGTDFSRISKAAQIFKISFASLSFLINPLSFAFVFPDFFAWVKEFSYAVTNGGIMCKNL